uniref:Uncharacterized protein n=1 Tax=Cacopsylla melanoneura TaxID=428564 RepID=A0A8D9E8V7_9HEMI
MFDYSPTPLTPRLILFCVLNSPLLSSSHPLFTPPPSIPFGLILYLSPHPYLLPPHLLFSQRSLVTLSTILAFSTYFSNKLPSSFLSAKAWMDGWCFPAFIRADPPHQWSVIYDSGRQPFNSADH